MKLYSLSKSKNFAQLVARHLGVPLCEIKSKTFADGEIDIEFCESVRHESLTIIAQIEMPYTNIMELMFMCDAARRSDAREINVVIPYLPHSRQERRGDKRSPISARVIADMLQNAGVSHIISMDLHIGAIEGFYKIPFDKLHPTEIFIEKIKSLNLENAVLCSPDFGFIKKMEVYRDALGIDMVVINKKRLAANLIESMELIGDVRGKHVILIDDMIDTGGTIFKATNELLDSWGALSVRVFATHGVLSGDYNMYSSAGNPIMFFGHHSRIEHVYVTNTMNVEGKFATKEEFVSSSNGKVEVVDVSSIFAAAIKKLYTT